MTGTVRVKIKTPQTNEVKLEDTDLVTTSHVTLVLVGIAGRCYNIEVDANRAMYICSTKLTLTVLVVTIDAQWEGMGDVGSARYKPALLPPCPTIRVLSYSNCQRSTYSISK